jgi:hypothetical protein
MGTSFGGGGDSTVTGRERQIKLDPALRNLQGLAKEKDNASNTTEYYSPLPPKDLEFVLHGETADAIELSGSLSDTVEPTWDGQTADEIRDELDATYGGRENWINSKEWDMDDGVTSTFDRTGSDIEKTQRTDPARDPAGQIITDPESDTPLKTPMDWDMDDINTQFKELDKEYSDNETITKARRDALRKEIAQDIENEKEIEQDGSKEQWRTNFNSMSDEEYNNINDDDLVDLVTKYGDKAFDGYLDSKTDRKDNASIRAVDNEIDDLNKAMDTTSDTDTASLEKTDDEIIAKDDTTVAVNPEVKPINYGDMSDEEYEKAYHEKMQSIVASGYDSTDPEYNEKEFDNDLWSQLDKLDSIRASQKKTTSDDNRAEWDMRRAVDQFSKLDKDFVANEKHKADLASRAEMHVQMSRAEQAQKDMENQYDKDNPEGFDKVSGQAGKAWDEIVKTGAEIADYTGADDAVDAVTKGASDAYDYTTKGGLEKDVTKVTDYVTKGGINKDVKRFDKYIRSPQAAKDVKEKGKEHKAYIDKKASEVGDYFTGGEFGNDVDDASDWISNQWDSMFGDDKKESVTNNTTTNKPS